MRIKDTLPILLFLMSPAWGILHLGCSTSHPSTASCQRVAQKAEAKRLYDEIDRTDMGVFDTFANRDPHTADPRLLHGYLTLDGYAKEHGTTLSRMTFMERRRVLLDDAIKHGGASDTELTPDERKTLERCPAQAVR